jgi:hypothetical protein
MAEASLQVTRRTARMSKGSKPRPVQDQQSFDENWNRIFNKKQQSPSSTEKNNK